MNDRLESYLGLLDRSLKGKVPDKLRSERVAELRSHLHLSVNDLVEHGMPVEDATVEALRKLGNARLVAEDLISQHRGYKRRSAWVLSAAILGLYAILTMLGFFVPIMPYPVWLVVKTWSWIPMFALVGWQVWRTQRWLVGPVVILSLLWTLGAHLFFMLGHANAVNGGVFQYQPRKEREFIRKNLPSHIKEEEAQLTEGAAIYSAVLNGGHAHSKRGTFLVPAINELRITGWVPGALVSASRNMPSLHFLQVVSDINQQEADRRWREDGGAALAEVQTSLEEQSNFLQDRPVGYSKAFDNIHFMGLMLSLRTIAMQAFFLAVTNWLVLILTARRRRGFNSRGPKLA